MMFIEVLKINWLIEGSKWFDVDTMALGKALKEVYKNYKVWVPKAKQQGNYCKENQIGKMCKYKKI